MVFATEVKLILYKFLLALYHPHPLVICEVTSALTNVSLNRSDPNLLTILKQFNASSDLDVQRCNGVTSDIN